jgi:hypothetical protein
MNKNQPGRDLLELVFEQMEAERDRDLAIAALAEERSLNQLLRNHIDELSAMLREEQAENAALRLKIPS